MGDGQIAHSKPSRVISFTDVCIFFFDLLELHLMRQKQCFARDSLSHERRARARFTKDERPPLK